MRFFISYRRKPDSDRTLAHFLHDELKQAGHEVFIDVDIPVGTNWAVEIEQRIEWCDFLVVLLSAESVESEMVQGEVRLAHHRRRPDGRPRVLPIRVRYDGPLNYELDCYIGGLQYLVWTKPDDSQGILEELKAAAVAGVDADISWVQTPSSTVSPSAQQFDRPQTSVDLRYFTRRPGGALKATDPFYISRPQDKTIAELAELTGETLVIKAPRQMGKSSLLNRYLDQCHNLGKRWAFVDFQGFTNIELSDYLVFLRTLAATLARSLDIDDSGVSAFASQQYFSYFVEDDLIRCVGCPLVLAFDEVERIFGQPYQGDFFSLLRSWHNHRSKPLSVWEEVDLALVISTEPYLLIDRSDQSPFNVTPSVELGPFSLSDLVELNNRYGGFLGTEDLAKLFALLGGHPYLTRLAFYRLKAGAGMTLLELMERAADPDGPFGEHLRRMLLLLQEHSGLTAALRQVIANGTVSSEDLYHRLRSAGLVRRQNDRIVPANLLYARFFRGIK